MLHRLRTPAVDSRSETIWLTVYADLITNLMLVFLALYGLTIMGDDALISALHSMRIGKIERLTSNKERIEFDDIQGMLKREFVQRPDVTISAAAGLARIEFGENVLFESGLSDTKSTAEPILLQVAKLLKVIPYTVIVEGHTDNVPILPGSRYKDNRALSMARAMSVLRLLVDKGQLEPGQLAAAAYGAYKPRASNLTPSGRRMNRRVEIVFVKDFPFQHAAVPVKP